jgi:hypothetical protein
MEEEMSRAVDSHGPMTTPHEAAAVIREEFEEFWDEVKQRSHDHQRMADELIQVAAMCNRAVLDLNLLRQPEPTIHRGQEGQSIDIGTDKDDNYAVCPIQVAAGNCHQMSEKYIDCLPLLSQARCIENPSKVCGVVSDTNKATKWLAHGAGGFNTLHKLMRDIKEMKDAAGPPES